jgi:predicted double-glycine peptidase
LKLKELLVVIPHSGLVIPKEIDPDSLSDRFPELIRNVDWYTNYLYDFRDILANKMVTFPYCSILLEANRHPDIIEDCVPLKDTFGLSVYKRNRKPSDHLRKNLSDKYLAPFNKSIEKNILAGADFLLDGHSTISARGVSKNQIELMNFQHSKLDGGPVYFCPPIIIETYAEELRKRLPDIKITVNQSEYFNVYGHICAQHSVNALSRIGKRVPALLQETNHGLYLNSDGCPNLYAIERLRRAFAESLYHALIKVWKIDQGGKILNVPITRQTFDYDCGAKALQTLLAYYGVDIREDSLLKELNVSKIDGSSIESIVKFVKRIGFDVEVRQKMTIDDIKHSIDENHPVLVLLQAWADQPLTAEQWRHTDTEGHYAIAIGYGKDRIIFEDPSSIYRTWLKTSEFLDRWHDKDPQTGKKISQFGLILFGRESIAGNLQHMS